MFAGMVAMVAVVTSPTTAEIKNKREDFAKTLRQKEANANKSLQTCPTKAVQRPTEEPPCIEMVKPKHLFAKTTRR